MRGRVWKTSFFARHKHILLSSDLIFGSWSERVLFLWPANRGKGCLFDLHSTHPRLDAFYRVKRYLTCNSWWSFILSREFLWHNISFLLGSPPAFYHENCVYKFRFSLAKTKPNIVVPSPSTFPIPSSRPSATGSSQKTIISIRLIWSTCSISIHFNLRGLSPFKSPINGRTMARFKCTHSQCSRFCQLYWSCF